MQVTTDQLVEDRVLFPTDLLGRFIGSGGKNIKLLQGRHLDVSIRVSKDAEGDNTPIILKGKNKADVKSAKDEIKKDRARFIEEQQSKNEVKVKECRFGSACKRQQCSFAHPNYKIINMSRTEKRRNTNKPSKDE